MQRDLVAIVSALTAGLLGACSPASSDRCNPSPPREVKALAEMRPELCASPAGAATATALVSALRGPAPTASAVAPPPAVVAAEPSASVDPATCELDCARFCGGPCRRVSETTVECTTIEGGHPCGRSIEGAVHSEFGRDEPSQLAAMHELEAISAIAFDSLAEELEALDAPRDLVARARRNALEERRHTAALARLLSSRGVAARAARAPAPRHRTLFAVALENAVEGCARETLGAAVALAAAKRASSAELRRFYGQIADDELHHAQWSWDLDAWACARLDVESRRALDQRRRSALSSFARHPDALTQLPGLGEPARAELAVLITSLIAELDPGLAA